MTEKKHVYSFALLLEGLEDITSEIEDAVAAAGCTDGILGRRNGVTYLELDREAISAEGAVLSAIRDVERAGIGARVLRVEPDDVVSQAEIARRTKRPRETIRLWIEGKRGSADFPRPCSGILGRSLRWRWVEVARWLVGHEKPCDEEMLLLAEAIAKVNGALELRIHGGMYQEELHRLAAGSPT